MQFWFLEAGTWFDAVICGCEQFELVEVDNGDNFFHLQLQLAYFDYLINYSYN